MYTKNLRKIPCVSHEKYAKNVGFVFVKERRIVILFSSYIFKKGKV